MHTCILAFVHNAYVNTLLATLILSCFHSYVLACWYVHILAYQDCTYIFTFLHSTCIDTFFLIYLHVMKNATMCMFICGNVQTCILAHLYTFILAFYNSCMHAYLHVWTLAYSHIYAYLHTFIPAYLQTLKLQYLHSCIFAYLYLIALKSNMVGRPNNRPW